MMNSYCLYGSDNDSYAFRRYPALTENQKAHQAHVPYTSGDSRPRLQRCTRCGELLDKWNEPLAGLVLAKREYDISSTYDGMTVISKRFMATYKSSGLSGLIFRPLPDDPEFFAIQSERIVSFDAERRKTRFIDACPQCGQYGSVVGATPVYLKPGSNIAPHEFVRTDIEFGSDDEKHPLLLCGESAADALKTAQLKGLDLEHVEEPAAAR